MARNKRFLEGWDTVSVLGVGGFGKVYEIRKSDAPDKFKSALKVISIPKDSNEIKGYEDDGYDEKSIQKILENKKAKVISEFDLMSNFKGTSNIVSYEDHYVKPHANGIGWDILIRMELLTALPDYLGKKGYVSESDVIAIARDMCKALNLCSEKNIIHRDIKPQNIFRNDFGDYKLGDFGIAKESDHETRATKTGTYSYMAPEVYRGEQYGKSVDIYSLGMVLYWLLNEKRGPFLPLPPVVPSSSDQEQAAIRRFSGERIPAPKHGSSQLINVVLRACECDPARRYHSAQEMLNDLYRLSGSDDPLYRVEAKRKKEIPVEQESTDAGETLTLLNYDTEDVEDGSMRFEVSFDPDNGDPVKKEKIKAFDLVRRPENPVKPGFRFVGWYNYGVKYNFNKPVDHGLYLKAFYKKKTPYLKLFVVSLFILAGVFFYFVMNGEEIGFLRKHFYKNSFIVYFDGNGGKSQVDSMRIEENQPIVNTPSASLPGKYFDGWYDNPVTGNYYDSSTPITENIKLYAHFSDIPKYYDEKEVTNALLTLNPNGGVCNVSELHVVTDEVVEELPVPYWKGHDFIGWSDENKEDGVIFKPGSFSVVGHVNLYAIWKETGE